VLVVDDDVALRRAVARALGFERYLVEVAEDGAQALAIFEGADPPFDVVVLDLLMPNLDGMATCRMLRATSSVPILMLTARDAVSDCVDGLDAGADDYLVKPFELAELTARLRALLRRTTESAGPLRYGELKLDPSEHRVYRAGQQIELTKIEFSLLEFLLANSRKVLARATIYEQVWGYDIDLSSNSLEVYISSLRRKIEAGGRPRLIQTIRGIGYALREEP
jgi:two-component system, OmpR family, response regulator MprA